MAPGGRAGPPPTPTSSGRLGKGQQHGQQQAAVGPGLDPLAPAPRPPPAVVAARRQAARARRAAGLVQPRGARTDGAEGWQPPVVPPWPDYTVSWDISPAPESRWDPATALLGPPHPQRLAWGGASREPRLAGPTAAVITALAAALTDPTGTAPPRPAGRRTVGASRRHQP